MYTGKGTQGTGQELKAREKVNLRVQLSALRATGSSSEQHRIVASAAQLMTKRPRAQTSESLTTTRVTARATFGSTPSGRFKIKLVFKFILAF